MKIGELARRTQCSVETIRYYEREGLLPATQRSEGNYRVYNESHAERLMFVRSCRSLDMTQDEIRQLLRLRDHPQENCSGVSLLVDEHIAHVEARISGLDRLRQQLLELRGRCSEELPVGDCEIIRQLNSGEVVGAEEQPESHVGRSHPH